MVFESIVVDLLNRYVGEYVENLDSKQLKIGIWGGDVVLENLVMKQSALDDLNLPVKTVHGHLGKLILKIPWKNLYSSPTEATVEKLFLLVVPNQDIRYDPEKEEKWKQEAKQAEIEKVEAAKKKELEKDKPKADDTFTEKMITQIVRNVQICIKDIHIRYEDRVTCPKSPFSFGITLHNLSVTTTNENWIPAISQDVTAKIFKHLTIDGLAIYWNSNCELFSLLESQGMNKRFKAGIPSKGQLVIGYKYMVGPISCTAKLQLNTKPELDLFQEPKALFNIEMEKVQLKISKLQYRDVFALVDSLDRMRRAALYRKYRPQVNTYRGHYKLWWKYAYTCILEEEVRRRRRNWDWVHIFTHRATCRKYAEAYQAKLLASSKESLETCRDCEIALDAFNIVLIRQKIEVEVERQGKLLEAKKKSEKAKGWFSGWWGKESSETAIEEQSKTDDIKKQFAEAMSGEEKEKLFRAIGYQENFVPDDLPVEFVAVRLNFLLQCLEVEVRDDDLEDEKSVMRVILNQMELQLEQRPSANAIRVSSMMYNLSATGLKQVDGLPEVCSSLHSIEGDGKTPLVKIIFETNPLCGTCDHRVHAEFKPLQVVYDAQTIIKLTDIFTPQEDQSAVVSQLQAAYQMKMAEMKEKSALGLQYTIQKHTRLDLKIDVMASHVIIPHGGFYNKKQPILVYNLGKFSVSSRLRQEDPLNVRNMHKEGYSEDKILDILRAESYDHFILKMEAAQVLLAYPDEDWLPLCCNHKQSDLHLLNPTDLTIEIHKCLIADDPRLPKVKIKGSLPQITLRIKEKRMVDTLVLLMSIPFTEAKYSKSYDQDQGFQLYLSTLSITPHDMNRLKKQKTVNMQLEDEEIIQYTDVEANFELQQIFIEVIAERGALSYSPTVSMSVLKLEAALLVQTFQISGEARLGGLELLHNFESKVIKVIDTPMASGKNEDLLILNYLSADKESPEFHSRYGSILQLLTVHFSKLNVLVHQEALMFLVHWIGKTQSYIEEQASALGKKKQDERPNTLTVRKESHFQASLTNLQESMREIWHPSSIKVGAAKKVKGKRVEVIDLKLDAKLDEIGITLSNNMHDLSRLEVSGCNSSIIMKKSYTQIDAKLTNFQVFDFNMNTAYPKVLKIVGKEELMTAQLVLFNEELLQRTTDAVNMSVKADIGCVRIVFINRFLTSVIGFMNNFQTAQEKLREASAAAAEAARTNVRQAYSAAVKIRLSITLKAPIIVIPENSKSSKALFFDLGFLTISNNFQDIVTKQDGHTAVIDHISLNLVNLKVSRVLLDDEGAIKTEQNILKPITFDLSVHRNLSCGWYTDVPDLDVGARLGTILIQLTNNDYVTLMSIVSENLAEVDSSYTKPDSFVCKDPSITAVAISKSSTSSKALSHGLGKGSVKLPQSDITTSIKFNFRLESIIVELFSDNEETDASNRRNSLRSQSLARMTLHLLSLKGVMLSDGTIASSVLMLNLLLDDTRASKASKINRYMERVSQDIDSNLSDDLVESQFPDPEDNNSVTPSNRRAMVDATIRLKDGNLYLDLRVYSFVLILNLEHLLKIRDLFVVPEKPELMDAAKKNSAKIVTSSVSYVTKPQAQAELQIPKDNEIMRNIDIHLEKPDIILVENLDDVNTNALNLQMEMNAKLSMSGSGKHQSISANIMDLQLFTCCYNPEKRQNTKSLVLFPFCVSLVGTTPEDNGLHLDLSTTKIHLSVSPGTIELLNKCYQTLYDEGMDNKSNRKDTDYSNVWSVSRVYEKDFWFLNSEVAQDALEVLTIESSVEVFAPLDEVCSVCVPSLVITLETGSGKHTIPCLLLESTASGKVHNWSSDLSLNMEITLQMNYYNCSLALWEPILEPIESFEEGNRVLDPWKLNMVMKKSIAEDQQSKEAMEAKPPTITINIQSLEAMELTITKTCLEVLTSIGASFQEAIYKPETTDKSEIEAPYKVQNDTGMSITVVLTDDSFKVSGVENTDSIREVVLKPDASVPLSALDLTTNEDYNRRSTFQDKRSPSFQTSIVNRLSVRSIEERYLNLKIEELNGAEVQIPVMKVDKRYFTLHRINSPDTSSKVYMEQIGLVVDITLESNATMKVTLCSIIRLYNNFSVAISVYFMTKKGNEVQLIASIPPKSHFNLPVQAIYTPTKEIFFSVDGYSLSTHPFIWKEVQSNWTFSKLLQCNSKNSEDKEPFFIKAVGEVEQVFFEFGNRHTMNSNCININLNPPVVLKNLLPIDIICCVQGIVTENTIKSGDVFEIPTCEPGSSSIVLRISGYLDREWSCKNSVAEEPPELDVWIFECYESPQRICFELGMHSVIKNGCLVMQLYCPFWMINKTALSLCYRRSGKPTTETVNTGIPTEQPDDMSNVLFHPDDFKGPVMFSFRAKNFFGKKKATIKVENGEWSEKFSLDVVGSYGVVSCVTNSIKYQIGVNIQLMSNSLTKQVILTPYNVLVNNSPQTTLEYKENIKGGEWNSISPLSCCPFYPKSAGGSQLIVRVAKTSQETLSFPYDTIHNSLLKLDNEFGGVSVDVQITEGSVHITFDDFGPELATALIVNNTDFEIVLKEKNIEHETITLPPNHKTLFCWSTFNEDRFITWNEKYKTDLLKSDVGEFNVASNVTAYFASFLDGRQKILLFTMDATIVQTVQNAGQIEQFDSEIILSIHGIGLSLVDNIKLNEILYLGITSSVSWESLKSNKKQFKALPEAQNELLEEEYQLYLQRKRQGGNVPSVVSVGDKMIDFESFMVKKPHEKVLNRAYRTGFWVSYKQSKRQVQLHSKINRLQIDNQMQDCIFPVVLAPVPPPKSVAQHHAIKPFVEVSVVECLTERSAIKQFKYFKVLMQEFHVKVDVGFINSIVSFLEAGDISDAEEMKRFKNDCKSIDEELMSRVELISSREQKNYYDFFHFSPIKMHVSFSLSGGIGGSGGGGVHGSLPPIVSLLTQSLGVTLTDMHDVVFKLSYFERQYIFINQRQIMYEIQTHYIGQLIKQFYVLVFGLDVLGNPYGLVVGLKHGVEDLFYEPFQIKMGKKKKVTDSEKEKIRKIKRECERKRRQRLKEDPLLYQEHLQKEKERYKARVENGKIKKVSQMNEREKRAQRKKVKEKVRKHREKKKRENEINQMLNNNTPPGSDSDEAIPVLPIANNVPPAVDNILIVGRVGTSRKESGKRLAKKNKSKCYRELEKLKEKLKESNKRGDKYKKKLFRLKKKIANKNSPNTKTQQFLRGEKVSPRVRKQLQFSNALSCQIQENFKTNQHSRKSLKAFSLVLSGKIVKKYKAITQMKDYVGSYYKKMNKVVGKGNIHETLKTLTNYKTKNIKIKLDVVKFFEQDNVSRLEPGKKDCITRLKVKKQKRILTGSLSSLHKKFEVEYGYNIPYSEFCSFRPFWVLKANMKYRKTCLCEKHDNIELIIKKLKDLKVIDAIDSDGLVKALCCLPAVGERTKENCIERKCEECRDKQIKINTFENKEIEIEQWKREKKKIDIRGKEKLVMRVVKEVLNKTIKDVVKMLLDMIPIFMSHTANIVHQYRTIFELKQNLQENDILLHIDFSENYICKYGQEIQSVHFGGSHQQITLHTGVAYVKTQHDQPIQVISFCSLSESLKHDAPAITAHLQKILNYLKEKMGGINNLHFLSDSPSTQYRNRNMFFFMKEVLRKFCSKDFTWNYSESGHGKGAPDGIGGTLKRTADRLVAEGKDLASFQSLFSALEENTNIDLFSVSLGDIENFEKILKPGIKSFVGTMKCHQITLGEHATELNIRRLSCFNCSAEAKCSHFHLGLYNAGPSERDNSASLKNRVLHEDVYSSSSGEEIEDEKTKEKIVIGLYNAGPSERDKSPSLKKRVLYEDVYSSSSGEETEDKKTKEKIVIAIGDWVVVIYDDIWYPGIVEKRNGPNVEINFMHWNKGGKTFYWPSAADVQNVAIENILCRIKKHPHPISSRQFALNDDEFKRIENNFNNLTL